MNLLNRLIRFVFQAREQTPQWDNPEYEEVEYEEDEFGDIPPEPFHIHDPKKMSDSNDTTSFGLGGK